MQAWQLQIICLICGLKFSVNRALKHKNKKHPELNESQFLALVKHAVERREEVFDTRKFVTETKMAGKSAFSNDVRGMSKWFTIVPGGAIGLGKKR